MRVVRWRADAEGELPESPRQLTPPVVEASAWLTVVELHTADDFDP